MKLPLLHFSTAQLLALSLAFGLALAGSAGWELKLLADQQQSNSSLKAQSVKALGENDSLSQQLKVAQSKQAQLEKDFTAAKSDAQQQKYSTIDALYAEYQDIIQKVARNSGVKLDTSNITNQYAGWGNQLLAQQFDDLKKSMDAAGGQLDQQFTQYQASLVKATPTPAKSVTSNGSGNSASVDGYSAVTAQTSRGSFSVNLIKMPLSSVTVKTVSASSSDCANNCPTKTLAQYVSENGAYAGINGTYFAPPDYSSSAGKVNSFDFAFYNSNTGNWLNPGALSWNSEGLAIFNGHSASFYHYASDWGGGAVTAGIANFPTLLVQNGQVIISDGDLDSAQKTKGRRGALGIGGGNIYLAVINNASILDAAYAMQSLGASDALNLDGGGSSALYIGGSYKVGPGRLLPNAVVLVR